MILAILLHRWTITVSHCSFCISDYVLTHVSACHEANIRQIRHTRNYCARCTIHYPCVWLGLRLQKKSSNLMIHRSYVVRNVLKDISKIRSEAILEAHSAHSTNFMECECKLPQHSRICTCSHNLYYYYYYYAILILTILATCAVELGYNDIGLCDTPFIESDIPVVPINSSLLTVTIYSSVITALVYNDTHL